jgi:hypothetical protein
MRARRSGSSRWSLLQPLRLSLPREDGEPQIIEIRRRNGILVERLEAE